MFVNQSDDVFHSHPVSCAALFRVKINLWDAQNLALSVEAANAFIIIFVGRVSCAAKDVSQVISLC